MIRVLFLSLLVMMGVSPAFGAACYPGLDCPPDVPRDAPGPYNPPPATQPPVRAPVQPQQPIQNQAYDDCSNPYAVLAGAMLGAMLGLQQNTVCTQPATHCCFEDGSAVPMVYPGSIRFADPCYTQIPTILGPVPVQGLGCRR